MKIMVCSMFSIYALRSTLRTPFNILYTIAAVECCLLHFVIHDLSEEYEKVNRKSNQSQSQYKFEVI